LLLLGAAIAGCTQEQKKAAPPAAEQRAPEAANAGVSELPSPAGANAAEPFLFATGDGVLLSWLEPVPGTDRTALRFSRYRGSRWSAPRTIIERNDLFVNWADFPSIVEDAKGALFAHWLQKRSSGTYSYDVRMATSTDGGASWGEPFLLNRDGKQSEHGFATLVPLSDGGVAATWLDGRNMKGGGEHEEHDAGDMTVRYATVSADGTLRSEAEIDPRTCECCTTGMTMAGNGPVIVYRDRSSDETRDISYVRHGANGWSEPRPIRVDGWKIAGCPVNGPQIDAAGAHVVAAWFSAANEQQRVYAAFSGDGGATFGQATVVDDGKPAGRVDVVMLDDTDAVVSWLEQTPAGAEVRARRLSRDGKTGPSVKIAASSSARTAGFTRLARSGADVWFTWTEQTATSKRIHVARGRI
jgi:hypothetical protein